MGAGWPVPAGRRLGIRGYLGISPFPSSQLMPDLPKLYSKQRASSPNVGKNGGRSSHQLPPRHSTPSDFPACIFRFAFSKALSAPGASAAVGPREPRVGVHSSGPPATGSSFPGQYSTNTPFFLPTPSQPMWKNIKIPKLLQ